MKNAARRGLGICFKLFGVVLAFVLIRRVIEKNDVHLLDDVKASIHWLLAAAFLLYGAALYVTAVRWQRLLEVQGVNLRLWAVVRLMMIGIFFNLVVPGAVGGDVIKMAYVSQRAGDKKAEAVLTILVDRIVGLLGLLLVAAASVIACFRFMMAADQGIRMTTIFVGICSLGGISAMAALEWHDKLERLPGVAGLLAFGGLLLPAKITDTIRRVVAALDLYRQRRRTMVLALGLSVLVHTLLAICVFCLGRAYHLNTVKPRHYFLATQMANTIAGIPISPGGLGVRDVALSPFLRAAGAEPSQAGDVAASLSIVIAAWSLIGGVIFLFSRYRPRQDDAEPEP